MDGDMLKTSVKRLESRRNEVYLATVGGHRFIMKKYVQPGVSEREREALEKLREHGVRVPEILSFDGGNISLQYVDGCTCEAVLCALEDGTVSEQEADRCAEALCAWLASYYKVTGVTRGDINFRNFIWDGVNCTGIDFEDETSNTLPPESDAGRVITFAATYRPMCTDRKAHFCKTLISSFVSFGMDKALIKTFAFKEVDDMILRRPKLSAHEGDLRAFLEMLF